MYKTFVKRPFRFLILFTVVSLACDMSFTVASPTSQPPIPTSTTIPPTEVPTQIQAAPTSLSATLIPQPTATALQPSFEGTEVSVEPLSIVLSPEVASGVCGLQIPRAEGEGVAPWEVTPGHIQLKLEGYALQDR